MKYKITVTTPDDRTMVVRLTAKNQADAISILQRQQGLHAFLDGDKIHRIEVEPDPTTDSKCYADTCKLERIGAAEYRCTDNETGAAVEFTARRFNETAHSVTNGTVQDEYEGAKAMKRIADWLQCYRLALVTKDTPNPQAVFDRQMSVAADRSGYTADELSALSGVGIGSIIRLYDNTRRQTTQNWRVSQLIDTIEALGYTLTLTPKQ